MWLLCRPDSPPTGSERDPCKLLRAPIFAKSHESFPAQGMLLVPGYREVSGKEGGGHAAPDCLQPSLHTAI